MNTSIPQESDSIQLPELVQRQVDLEERIKQLEGAQNRNRERLESLSERESVHGGFDTVYITALAFCRRDFSSIGLLQFAHKLDELAAEKCRNLGILIGHEPNAFWGRINLYPVEILEECIVVMDGE